MLKKQKQQQNHQKVNIIESIGYVCDVLGVGGGER